jgi:putative transposase
MAAEHIPVEVACRVLDVSTSGYYAWRSRPPSARAIRHIWLTDRIAEIHQRSRGTYGALRVHAELRLGHGIVVGHNAVAQLMRRAGLAGATGRPKWRHAKPDQVGGDLVDRHFARSGPNQLWVTDIPSTPPARASCTAPSSSTHTPVGWSAGRSTPRRPRRWSPTPSACPSRPAPYRAGRSSTPTRGAVCFLGVHPPGQGLGAGAVDGQCR